MLIILLLFLFNFLLGSLDIYNADNMSVCVGVTDILYQGNKYTVNIQYCAFTDVFASVKQINISHTIQISPGF